MMRFVVAGAGALVLLMVRNSEARCGAEPSFFAPAAQTCDVGLPTRFNPLIGDVNGDKRADLIFVGQDWNGTNNLNVRVKLASSTVTWSALSQVLGDGKGVHKYRTIVADVNKDDRADLIFVGPDWSGPGLNVRVKMANRDGTWTAYSQVIGDGSAVLKNPVLVGDVNKDGMADLIFVGQDWTGNNNLNVRVKLSNGDGTWMSKVQVLGDGAGVHRYPALIADVNGDHRSDLVFVGQDWDGPGLNIRVKFSNGDGTWTAVSQVLGDGQGVHTYPTLVGDVNHDGNDDLVFVGRDWSGHGLNVRTKISDGHGAWTSHSQVLGDGAGVLQYPTLIGDVNKDGNADLVFVGQDWNANNNLNVRVKFSNGDGSWTAASEILGDGAGVHRYPTHLADVDGDGLADLIFIGFDWDGPGLNIRVKRSKGDGTWTPYVQVLGDGRGVLP